MDRGPPEYTSWSTPAGTQTACWGGTTHVPSPVVTRMTPSEANTSWARKCRCQGNTRSPGLSLDAVTTG